MKIHQSFILAYVIASMACSVFGQKIYEAQTVRQDVIQRSWTDIPADKSVFAWVPSSGKAVLCMDKPSLPLSGYDRVIAASAERSPVMAVHFNVKTSLINTWLEFSYFVPESVTASCLSINIQTAESNKIHKSRTILQKGKWISETWSLSELMGGDYWRMGPDRTLKGFEFAFDSGKSPAKIELANVRLISKPNGFGTPLDPAFPPIPRMITLLDDAPVTLRSEFVVGASLAVRPADAPWAQVIAPSGSLFVVNGKTVTTCAPTRLPGEGVKDWPSLMHRLIADEISLKDALIPGRKNTLEIRVPARTADAPESEKKIACAIGWMENDVRRIVVTDESWTPSPAVRLSLSDQPDPTREEKRVDRHGRRSDTDIFPMREPVAWSEKNVVSAAPEFPHTSLRAPSLQARPVIANEGGQSNTVARWQVAEFGSNGKNMRWFFKDPSGRPFFFLSTQAVVLAHFNYAYYRSVLSQYQTENQWAEECVSQQAALGYNSIAVAATSWSIFQKGAARGMHGLHYFDPGYRDGPHLVNAKGEVTKMIDPFDPVWKDRYEARLARQAQEWNRDDTIIGYYVGNEMPLANSVYQGNTQCAYVYSEACGREFKSYLAEKYGQDITALNAVWQKSYTSFDDILTAKPDPFDNGTPSAMLKDFQLFTNRIMTVFASHAKAMRDKYMPNKLILSQRFQGRGTAGMLSAFKGYDVIALNMYPFIDGLGQDKFNKGQMDFIRLAHTVTGSPVIISEWGGGAIDSRMTSRETTALTQTERGEMYKKVLQQIVALPFVVGSSHFAWQDMPDNEKMNWGIVDVAGKPYVNYVSGIISAHEWLNEELIQMGY